MDSNKTIQHWDKMYNIPLRKIPWEIKDPPKELVETLSKDVVAKGKALDIGCGTGNYSFYLAKCGFNQVIGVDFSEKALTIAKQNNKTLNLPVDFMFVDITKLEDYLSDEQFEFILDYSILHHLEPSAVDQYAQQCTKLLKSKGKLLLVCYSDKDEFAHGDALAKGTYGNMMFYRTADEIRNYYKDLKEIYYKEARLGKRLHHKAHCFLFEKP